MSQPPQYQPGTDFSDEERDNVGGRSTVRTAALDTELTAIATSINAIRVNLALNQRDDGEIRDARVKLFTLSPDVLNLLATDGVATPRGAWLTTTAYALKDIVTQSGSTYLCAVAHTSGTFATDLAAVKWLLIAGPTQAAALVPFTPTATLAATNVQAAIDEADTENRTLSAAASTAVTTLEADLLSTASLSKGAGKVGFLYSLAYGANTVGKWLKDLAASTGATFIGWTRSATGAVLRTLSAKQGESNITPEDFGAVGSGAVDDYPAFALMATHLMTYGGTAQLTPGKTYRLDSTWVINVTNPVNWKIVGWGAQITNGAAVTGYALQVLGSYNEFQGEIEGMYFNHRGNTTAQGCFQLKGAHCVTVRKNTVEMHSVKAGYTFLMMETSTPGATEDDYNCFWNVIENNSTRKRSSGEAGFLTYGIRMTGACNATVIRDNSLAFCDYGIYADSAATTKSLPNGIVIEANAFELINTAAVHAQMTPAQLGITGWRVVFNRIELCPTFFSLATGGAAATQHQQPPFLMGNYCQVTPSVNTWVLNPTGYTVSTFETRFPGFAPAVDNQMWLNGGMTFNFPASGQLSLNDASGTTSYDKGRISWGTTNMWVNTGTGKLMIKTGVPANAADGTIVGTQT